VPRPLCEYNLLITKRILPLLLSLITLSASAQSVIIGTVQDAVLKTPLPEAKVSLLAADSTVLIDSVAITKKHRADGTVKEAQFIIDMEKQTRRYFLRASLKGYDDAWMPLSINGDDQRALMLDNPLELRRMRTIDLKDVVVTATKIKMYFKGDTIVYDATAFKLPDGSMLDDLIRQMPGVTMNDNGEIFVNNRKIDELQLASRSFMGGNSKVLLKNLPYYTVKNIKVYDQDTDLNRALGAQVEKKKFVMDVNLKPEFQIGYLANVEAAGGTQHRWLGRGFLLGFNNCTRYTLLANGNNVNESRHIGSASQWTPTAMPNSLLTTYSTAGEIDYQRTDKNLSETLNFDYTSTRNESEMLQRRELFLAGNPMSMVSKNSMAKEHNLKASNRFKYIKPERYQIDVHADFSHKSYNGHFSTLTEQYVDSLTTRQQSGGFNEGHAWTGNFNFKFNPKIKNIGNMSPYLALSAFSDFSSDKNQQAQRYVTENFVHPSASKQHNASDFSAKKFAAGASLTYLLSKGNDFYTIDIAPSYSRNKSHDWLYHPDTLLLPSQIDMLQAITDPANSYDSDENDYKTDITFHFSRLIPLPATKSFPVAARANFLDLYLHIAPMHERLHYQRGAIDTAVTRNTARFEPRLEAYLYVKKERLRPLFFRLMHTAYNAPLINQINLRDDATPLVVHLGNPDLKKWFAITTFWLEYKDISHEFHNWNVSTVFFYNHNVVAQSVRFNPQTGVYTYRPENVSGSYDIQTKAGAFFTLDANRLWTAENNYDGSFAHWRDHAMLSGETESHLNATNILTLHDNLYLQYNKGVLNVRATGDASWRHSEGKRVGISTLNVFDYRYGLAARYTLPVLKTTISADGNMYSRRGYGSANLNTDDLVLNASVSQSLLKGKLIASLEAFDLFHQLSNTQYEVNAQGRVETWYRSLPHYVMLHVVYHWNKSPMNKKKK
jgi:hypothetical protein